MPDFHKMVRKQLRTAEQGSDSIVYLAAVADVAATGLKSGDFIFDRQAAAKHLLLAGTQYTEREVERLMNRLKMMVEDKGFQLASAAH